MSSTFSQTLLKLLILAAVRQICTPVKQDQHGGKKNGVLREGTPRGEPGGPVPRNWPASFGKTIEGLSSLIIIGVEFFWQKRVFLF